MADACKRKNVEAPKVIDEIRQVMSDDHSNSENDSTKATLTKLVQHIVGTHHGFLQTELPRVSALIAKVNSVHGDKHPELAKVLSTFSLMLGELESPKAREERILAKTGKG